MPPENDRWGGHASPLRFDLTGLPELCDAPGQPQPAKAVNGIRQRAVRNAVFLGAGPSLLAAKIFRDLIATTASMPVLVHSDYTLPAFVGPDTLVVALSYSGVSEETIYAVADVSDKGAQMLAVTSGGHLRDIAHAQAAPCLLLPPGIGSSVGRIAAIVFAFCKYFMALRPDVPLLGDAPEPAMAEAIGLLRRQRDVFAGEGVTAATQLAEILARKSIVVLASPSLTAVADCWKYWLIAEGGGQCDCGAFPSVEHGGLLELGPDSLLRRWDSTVILLRDRRDDALISARIDAARDRMHEAAPDLPIHEIYADGQSRFARIWTTLYLGAWVSCRMSSSQG